MRRVRSLIDLAAVAVPKAVGGACLIAINIWLMRLMPPELFGVYTLCVVLMALLSEGVVGAAIDMSVLRLSPLCLEHDPERAIDIEREALRLKLLIIGSLALVLCVFSVPLSRFLFHRTDSAPLIMLVCVASIAALLLASTLLHLQVRSRFRSYGAVDAMHVLLKFGGIAAFLLMYRDSQVPIPIALVLMWFALGPAFAVGVFWFSAGSGLFKRASHGQHGNELIAYAKWIFATLLVSTLVARLDVLLLALLGTMGELGVYSGGQTIASIPLLFGSYLGILLNPKVMPFCRSGKFFGLLRAVQLPLFAFCIFFYGFAFFLQAQIRDVLFSSDFQESAEIVLILLPSTLLGMTSFPLAITFLMFISPRFLLWLECLLFPGLLIAYLILIPPYGAWGAAVVTLVVGVLKTLIAQGAAVYLARKCPAELGLEEGNLDP